jgi:hypothetical protein
VIVIADEAHRSQYDTAGDEHAGGAAKRAVRRLHWHAAYRGRGATREVFGDYVSDLRLPAVGRGRRDGAAVLREPHARAEAHEPDLNDDLYDVDR